jgi:hypothetical protein
LILLCGVPSERPLEVLRLRLDQLKAKYLFFNQHNFAQCDIELEIRRGRAGGRFKVGRHTYPLADFQAIYMRTVDEEKLPELSRVQPGSELRRRCRGLHNTLTWWTEITPGMVVNRCGPSNSNSSKPFQSQLIRRHGFLIPETLITSIPDLVRDFRKKHKRVIFKSISGVRSIVKELGAADTRRLDRIRSCPTQFQAYVQGTNVRVHVIENRVYATAVRTRATDYRYALLQCGRAAHLREVRLTDELTQQCIQLARSLGLVFAGIDLKITPDNRVYCFEVNPSPAYNFFEANSGQPISDGLSRCLMEADGQLHGC